MSSVDIEALSIDDISQDVLKELKDIYKNPYYNTHMYEDLIEDIESNPDIFKLFIARENDKAVGAFLLESKDHSFINYLGYEPVHGKRFTVLEEYRGVGIGQLLLQKAKNYAFNELGLKVIFGESNEVGALALYGREGGLYCVDVIKKYSDRNSPEDNIKFFKEFIANPIFRNYRFPAGDGIFGACCANEDTASFFKKNGYISIDELLNY